MDPLQYFLKPNTLDQKKYDALRAYYLEEGTTQKKIAERFGYALPTFNRDFHRDIIYHN